MDWDIYPYMDYVTSERSSEERWSCDYYPTPVSSADLEYDDVLAA